MATSIDLSNEILRAFANSRQMGMTLTRLHNVLGFRVTSISPEEILQEIQSAAFANLMDVQSLSANDHLIRLNPKLYLCGPCLQNNCKNKNVCSQLHLCRIGLHYTNPEMQKSCRFPHKLSDHPNNRRLLQQFRYDTLNEDVLLDLLRLEHKNRAPKIEPRVPPPSLIPSAPVPATVPKPKPAVTTNNVEERQLDIVIPAEKEAPIIDLEIVELLLGAKHVEIDRILDDLVSNEYHRRFTVQLKDKKSVKKVFDGGQIIIHDGFPIKMKRKARQRDSKNISLKIQSSNKVHLDRVKLYVETLVKQEDLSVHDMTPEESDEQIFLIQCREPIDFASLNRSHEAQNTLQGSRVVIEYVYESQTLNVSFKPKLHPSMTLPRLQKLFGTARWDTDVFTCLEILDRDTAQIELMNDKVTREWLADAGRIESDLSLIIRPILDFIPAESQGDELRKTSPMPPPKDPPKPDDDPSVFPLKPDWCFILTHPPFGRDYQKYISDNLHISVQIVGSNVHIAGSCVRRELARFTNMFVQKYVIREVRNLDKTQVKLIKDNQERMAFQWQPETKKTRLAASREVMSELLPQLESKVPPSIDPNTSPKPQLEWKKPRPIDPNTPPKPPTLQPLMSTVPFLPATPPRVYSPSPSPSPSLSPQKSDNQLDTLSHPIDKSIFSPFMSSPKLFIELLTIHLRDKFAVKFEIKSKPSQQAIYELNGQPQEIHNAQAELTSLFSSVTNKLYSKHTHSAVFGSPNLYHVVQWQLNQSSILASCGFVSKDGESLSVKYYASDSPFGTKAAVIDDIVLQQLKTEFEPISHPSQNLRKNLNALLEKIQKRSDYGHEITCWFQSQNEPGAVNNSGAIYLYGKPTVVDQLIEECRTMIGRYRLESHDIALSPYAVSYLLQMCGKELIQIEKDNEADGVDLRSKLHSSGSCQFLAPDYLKERVKVFLLERSHVQVTQESIRCSRALLAKKQLELIALARTHHSLLTIDEPPRAAATDVPRTPTNLTQAHMNPEMIHVSRDDLLTAQADVLVICTTSAILCDAALRAAGPAVREEFRRKVTAGTMFSTSPGQLTNVKQLLFLQWSPPAPGHSDLQIGQSVSSFVRQSIRHAVKQRYQHIAFPAIGCGGFKLPEDLIASSMINAAREELQENPAVPMKVTFVIRQESVYNTFCNQLQLRSTADGSRTSLSPQSNDEQKVTLVLITPAVDAGSVRKLLVDMKQMLNVMSDD